jgi:ceramide glucosyltransferase
MLLWLQATLAAATGAALGTSVLAAGVAWRAARRPRPRTGPLPPVTILKPLKGVEDGLADNLDSLARQDYDQVEILCAVADPADPAVAAAEAFRDRFPALAIRVVTGIPDLGYNPKVSNLAGLLPHAHHELLLISDANVRVAPTYLADTVRSLLDADAALASNLFIGRDEHTVGAACENLHLAGFVAGGVSLATAAGSPCVVGKSMLLRRRDLAAVGGLPTVADVLAEDYVLGRRFHQSGRRVVLASHAIGIHNPERGLREFLARQLRWAQMRFRIAPVAYLFEPLLLPLALALLLTASLAVTGDLAGPLATLAGVTVAAKLTMNAVLVGRLRGHWPPIWALACAPLAEVLALAIWAAAMTRRTVLWRGHRLVVGRGSRLSRPEPADLVNQAMSEAA